MEKRELYDGIQDLETQTEMMLSQLAEVRKALTEVMEENAELRIENQHLHDFINEQKDNAENDNKKNRPRSSKSRENLEHLFNEGFHVCIEFYGAHRENDESCIFCNEILNR